MIEEGIIKKGQVILLYKQPVEDSVIALVKKIEYPILHLETIKGKEKSISLNISQRNTITIITDEKMNIFEKNIIKKIKKAKKEFNQSLDIFGEN